MLTGLIGGGDDGKFEELKKKHGELQAKFKEQKDKLETMKSTLESKEREIRDYRLSTPSDGTKQKYDEAMGQIENLKQKVSQLEGEKQELQGNLEEEKKETQRLTAATAAAPDSARTPQMSRVATNSEGMKQKNEEAMGQIENLEQKVGQLERQRQELQGNLEREKKEIQRLTDIVEAQSGKEDEAPVPPPQLARRQSARMSILATQKGLEEEIERIRKENVELQSEVQEQKAAAKTKAGELEIRSQELAKERSRLAESEKNSKANADSAAEYRKLLEAKQQEDHQAREADPHHRNSLAVELEFSAHQDEGEEDGRRLAVPGVADRKVGTADVEEVREIRKRNEDLLGLLKDEGPFLEDMIKKLERFTPQTLELRMTQSAQPRRASVEV